MRMPSGGFCPLCPFPVQIGGGIRTEAAVEYMLSLGVQRVIIGTKAAEEPEFLKKLVEAFGADRVAAGIDAKNGMVAVHGWEQVSGISAVELCRKMKEYGVRHIVLYGHLPGRHAHRPQCGDDPPADGRNRP